MPTIAELQSQLAAAEDAELAALGLDMLQERVDAVDRRIEKLARQLAEVRSERQGLAADRDDRIRRGAAAGLTATRLAEAAGVTRSRAAQIISEQSATPLASDANVEELLI